LLPLVNFSGKIIIFEIHPINVKPYLMVPVRIARSINSSDFGKLKSRLSEVGQLSNLASSQVVNYHGGPLLTSVQVYLIFWGIEWNQSPQNG